MRKGKSKVACFHGIGGATMKALVLAAGQGVRMGPLTENRPKPMLPVAGRPFLEHTIIALREAGIEEIFVLTGYHGNAIKDHFQDGRELGVRISYLIQPKRLGTAHAVSMARKLVDEPFLCLNGDVIVTPSLLKGLISKFEETGNNVMTLVEVSDTSRFGLVTIEDDLVKGIVEKSGVKKKGLINGGIYLFKPDVFDAIEKTPVSPRGEYEITNSIDIIMEKETVRAYVPREKWVDIGSPWDLLNAHEIYMGGISTDIQGKVEENVHIHGEVIVRKGAVIKSGTYIEGNVIIDEDAVIGPNSYIRGNTYIGKGSKVGAASEVKNSIIMDNSHIPHHNYVGDSIIGSGCNFGSGTKVANLRLDDGPVPVTLKGKKVSSGRRKLGVIIGDDVKTGINSTLDAGTMIFSGTRIGPGAHAAGTIGNNSRIQ
ncbi:MAG: bifunctional sugar-1-phosphate nucleotidylyltransferase/acetyltransferase [Thermoplasmatota archaeon]